MNKNIELLSPAGSYQGLIAAINAGCNAVYLGSNRFGARANAVNFTNDELVDAIQIAHLNNVKVYYTANTIIKEKELKDLYEQVKFLHEHNIDGLILQDLGAYHMIKKYFKDLPLHASTQMTIHNQFGLGFLQELGFERAVLSRECDLKEIKKIAGNTDLDIEIFIHGALCYCYSGQCLMSSIIGGRSGNRGQCAQTCRLPYDVLDQKKMLNQKIEQYWLSPKDVQTLNILPEILASGAMSFKLEGRMKSPEYVGLVTSIYRKYIDLYLSNPDQYEVKKEDLEHLKQIYNRGGFTKGYFTKDINREMMALKRPNHHGLLIGKVKTVLRKRIVITLFKEVHKGDYLELTNAKGEKIALYPKENSQENIKENVKENSNKRRKELEIVFDINTTGIKANDKVYRLVDKELNKKLNNQYVIDIPKPEARCVFKGEIGKAAYIELDCRGSKVSLEGMVIEKATGGGTGIEKIKKQLQKTGNDGLSFSSIDVNVDQGIFLPISEINRLRRESIELLMEKIRHIDEGFKTIQEYVSVKKEILNNKIRESNKIKIIDSDTSKLLKNESIRNYEYKTSKKEGVNSKESVSILLRKFKHFSVIKQYNIDRLIIELSGISMNEVDEMIRFYKNMETEVFLGLPRIIRDDYINRIFTDIERLTDFQGFLIRSIDQYNMVKKYKKKVNIDHNFHVINNEAIEFWGENNINEIVLSNELNQQQIRHLNTKNSSIMIYGYLPVMVSAQCIYKNINNKCVKDFKTIELKDRKGNCFSVQKDCNYCLNTIYNSRPTCLIDKITEIKAIGVNKYRLDFYDESNELVHSVMKFLRQALDGSEPIINDYMKSEFTRGHFNRGVK